ncbi:MAG TPA: glycosyltransferase family 2 protein [Acidisarcina sp.]|nr:glycosyltransferase family 2 protein [Acidisarcina sp.]
METLSPLGWVLLVASWVVALGWLWRVSTALRGLSRMPDLMKQPAPLKSGSESPVLAVVVPARNEEESIEATLRSLMAIEGLTIEIIAVDDRSTDGTGHIMDRLAAEAASGALVSRNTLRIHHVEQLPEGWMGKTHAMALAAHMTATPWLLFTDADIVFRADSLARALDFAERSRADHLVVFPTLLFRSRGERMMMSLLQALAIWASRPWKVADPRARRDFLGVGAFNMIRRSAYDAIGGFEALRMEVLEDVRLGYEVKHRGFAQRAAFGPELLHLHWASGAFGILNNLTKNAFAIFRFQLAPLLVAMLVLALLCLLPFAGFLLTPWTGNWILPASLLVLLSLLVLYRYYQRFTGTSFLYALTFPIAACLFLYAVLRSVALTLFRGGVVWRGTLYPLRELRKQCGPLW